MSYTEKRLKQTIIYDNGFKITIEGSEKHLYEFVYPKLLNDEEITPIISYTEEVGTQFKTK